MCKFQENQKLSLFFSKEYIDLFSISMPNSLR